MGRIVCADWFYYDSNTRRAITECYFKVLRDSQRPVRPPNFQTRLDHDVPPPGWEADDESNCNSIDDLISGAGIANGEVLNNGGARSQADNAHADALELQPVNSVQHALIMREFLIFVLLPKNNLPAYVSELCGYPCGQLGL